MCSNGFPAKWRRYILRRSGNSLLTITRLATWYNPWVLISWRHQQLFYRPSSSGVSQPQRQQGKVVWTSICSCICSFTFISDNWNDAIFYRHAYHGHCGRTLLLLSQLGRGRLSDMGSTVIPQRYILSRNMETHNARFLWASNSNSLLLRNTRASIQLARVIWYPYELVTSTLWDNSTWWRHQMEIFLRVTGPLWGNPSVIGGFPYNGQSRGTLTFSLICPWRNGWANNRDTGDLRRHLAYHYVTVMSIAIGAL